MRTQMVMTAGSDTASAFASTRYMVVEKMFPRDLMDIALRYFVSYLKVDGYYDVSEEHASLDRHGDALGEALLPEVRSQIESRTGIALLPTYSYARIYTTESRLTKHIDREACEISATLTVGYKNATGLWPILLERDGHEIAVELDVGDALIYKGMELPHWRRPLESGFWCQLFFHFVAADGPYAHRHLDGRTALGPRALE